LSRGLLGVLRGLKQLDGEEDPDCQETLQLEIKAAIGYLRNALLDQYFFYVCVGEGDASERTMMEAFMRDKQDLKDMS